MPREQIELVFDWYEKKKISKLEAMLKLTIGERRFFYLLKRFRSGKGSLEGFNKRSLAGSSKTKISSEVEEAIRKELIKEREIIHNPDIPTKRYNYAYVRDEMERLYGFSVSDETVRKRALKWGFYVARYKRSKDRSHDRMILTDKVGVLLQHDSSWHLFAPHASSKWHLITTIDDFSRMVLFARFVEDDTAWDHILSIKHVCKKYGIPANYYVDNHSIFRFVERMESYWRTPRTKHSDVLTQWETVLKVLGIGIFHAMSPQAKGKIERPYRWMQDRVVRRCAKEKVTKIEDGQIILDEEIYRYNFKTVHSTTGEIPAVRFERARKENLTAFKEYKLPKPLKASEDVFCLREIRKVGPYHTISWRHRPLDIPKYIPMGATILLNIIPDSRKPQVRIWYQNELVDVIFLAPTNLPLVKTILEEEEKDEKKD